MGWFSGTGRRSAKWALLAVGLLSTGCAGVVGVGAAVVVVGAGVLGFTCYDRVSVTVTDRLTGTKLCDAKVAFLQGKSETVATSCGQAALSAGAYVMRVERPGLETFEQPVEVSESGKCGQTIQTMFVALERKNRVTPLQQIAPAPAPMTVITEAQPPAVTVPPGVAPVPVPAATPSATPALPPAPPPPPSAAPASTAFPDAPR